MRRAAGRPRPPKPTPASPPEPEPEPEPPTATTLALTGDAPATFGVAIVPAAAPDALPLFDEREFACDLAGARSCAAHGHAELALGDHRLVALRFETRWEHDGMYGSHESIALVVPGPAPQIVHTHPAPDRRRRRAPDLDREAGDRTAARCRANHNVVI